MSLPFVYHYAIPEADADWRKRLVPECVALIEEALAATPTPHKLVGVNTSKEWKEFVDNAGQKVDYWHKLYNSYADKRVKSARIAKREWIDRAVTHFFYHGYWSDCLRRELEAAV